MGFSFFTLGRRWSMHLKDWKMPWSLDTRRDVGNIGEVYSSDELHHIQSIVQTKLLDGWIEQEVRGTCFVHQASKTDFDQAFDYGDNSHGCASMIRVGLVARRGSVSPREQRLLALNSADVTASAT